MTDVLLLSSAAHGRHLHRLTSSVSKTFYIDLLKPSELYLDSSSFGLETSLGPRHADDFSRILYAPHSYDALYHRSLSLKLRSAVAKRSLVAFFQQLENKLDSFSASGLLFGNRAETARRFALRGSLPSESDTFRTPASIVTQSLDVALRFIKRSGGSAVAKALPDTHCSLDGMLLLPQLVSLRQCTDMGELELPFFFQEVVEGEWDYRLYCFGGTSLCLKWPRNSSMLDARASDLALNISVCDAVEGRTFDQIAFDLRASTGLEIFAADFVWAGLTSSAKPSLVDLNPHGSWFWLPARTRRVVDEAFTAYLRQSLPGYASSAA